MDVLLIPGGAATSRDYYPRLPERLAGHRVVQVDRPGTAGVSGKATLAGGAAAWAAATTGPAVVVGHSLGAAVACQLAVDHPDLVAGLVLLDPTPFNDDRAVRTVASAARVAGRLASVPGLERLLWWQAARAEGALDADARRSLATMIGSASLADTAAAVRTLVADARALTGRLAPLGVPVVVVTADRKPGSRSRRAHERLAAVLGGELQLWPGTRHGLHLSRPEEVATVVASVLTKATAVNCRP